MINDTAAMQRETCLRAKSLSNETKNRQENRHEETLAYHF